MQLPSFFYSKDLRLIFFGGKGGVGKTSCATSAALKFSGLYADKSFLLVSTDPAHSVQDSLHCDENLPSNLKVLEFETQKSLDSFMDLHKEKLRQIALRGTFLDENDIAKFMDLSLPGMDELMAFLEITQWIEKNAYDCIIVDTAPTGHTLRLLTMPDLLHKWLEAIDTLLAKHRYMKKTMSGSYKKDEIDWFVLNLSKDIKKAEKLLKDYKKCLFVPVMLPEDLSVKETKRLVEALSRLKIPVQSIIVNKLFPENSCILCQNRRKHQVQFISAIKELFSDYDIYGLARQPTDVEGKENLLHFWDHVDQDLAHDKLTLKQVEQKQFPGTNKIEINPDSELFLFAGKGGVGKTTLACATAIYLANNKGHSKKVFLFSTDPAHSLSDCLKQPIGAKPTQVTENLVAMEIDASEEFDSLKTEYETELEKFLKSISKSFDFTFDRQVMERIMDLSPPGIDEIMALSKMMDIFSKKQYDIFVLDSAPTGHLIRLLEMPEIMDQWLKSFFNLFLKYKTVFRLPKVSQKMVKMSKQLKLLRNILTHQDKSGLFCVSHLTNMAFEESRDLVSSCKNMNIQISGMLLNLATPETDCEFCIALCQRESDIREKFKNCFSDIHQCVVYDHGELGKLERLEQLGNNLFVN